MDEKAGYIPPSLRRPWVEGHDIQAHSFLLVHGVHGEGQGHAP